MVLLNMKCLKNDCPRVSRKSSDGLCSWHYRLVKYGWCRFDHQRGGKIPADFTDSLCQTCRKRGYEIKPVERRADCIWDDGLCKRKMFSSGLCLRHYRMLNYGKCYLMNCFSPSQGPNGLCDNHSRRGDSGRRHLGKYINTENKKYCEYCKIFKERSEFYVYKNNSSYLCKGCGHLRSQNAKLRSRAWEFGIDNVVQTAANLCVKCWDPLIIWEADHIVPFSLGGSHSTDNLQIMCVHCNRTKSNGESIDYRVFLVN